MSKQYTIDECRAMFLDHCRMIARQWEGKPDAASGAVFSMLCLLDGVSGEMPAFEVVPSPHPDDKEFHRKEGENWWPDDGEEGIHGDNMLHDLFYRKEAP